MGRVNLFSEIQDEKHIPCVTTICEFSRRVDKQSASTEPAWKGGCALLIHPTLIAGNKFTLAEWAFALLAGVGFL
jgi:hypothetical protein